MPRRSRQSKWMKNSQNVNWRGQRPKLNLDATPIPKKWSIEQIRAEELRHTIGDKDFRSFSKWKDDRVAARLRLLLKNGGD